ncbi:MAG: hypothetical protein QOH99_1615 [Frankiaceae bacterium]|nr:hypothetical protein [Frankiaceae bacterium]
MTNLRRWSALAAFAALAGAWATLNWLALSDWAARQPAVEAALKQAFSRQYPGRVWQSPQQDWAANTMAHHVQSFWPAALLLVAAGLVGVTLRATTRGLWYLAAIVIPFAGTATLALSAEQLWFAAGMGVTQDAMPTFNAPWFDATPFVASQSLVWLGAALAMAAAVIPAMVMPPSARAHHIAGKDAALAVAFGAVAVVAALAFSAVAMDGQSLGGSDAAALGVAVALSALASGTRHRVVVLVVLATAFGSALVGESSDTTPAGLLRAVALGLTLAVVPLARAVPWQALRARINGSTPPATVTPGV